MKVEYVTPFVSGSVSVIQLLTGVSPKRGKLSIRSEHFTSQELNIVCGVTGDIVGQVIYGMSMKTANLIAKKMIGQPVVTFDQIAAAAIADFGKKINENSVAMLAQQGFTCDITPPTIIKGTTVQISSTVAPALIIPIEIPALGELEINVSLKENRSSVAA